MEVSPWEQRVSSRTGMPFYLATTKHISPGQEKGPTLAQTICPHTTSATSRVAAHYDNISMRYGSARCTESLGDGALGVRRLNNWVKAHVIEQAVAAYKGTAPITVLDVAAGKMGDRRKWCTAAQKSGTVIDAYVHTDISPVAVATAVSRKNEDQKAGRPVPSKFMAVVMDWLRLGTLPQVFIPNNQKVTHVNLMFCANYLWGWDVDMRRPRGPDSCASVQEVVERITQLCVPGAVLVMCYTDARRLWGARGPSVHGVSTRGHGGAQEPKIPKAYMFELEGAVQTEEHTMWQGDVSAVLVSAGWELQEMSHHDALIRLGAKEQLEWPDCKKDHATWSRWCGDSAIMGTLGVYTYNLWVLKGKSLPSSNLDAPVRLGKKSKTMH